jgi:hypothetical protein
MADKKSMTRLDERLVGLGIVSGAFLAEFPLVHRKMNSIVRKTGAELSDSVFESGNAELRAWLTVLSKRGASQDKLTAYLRCALAHLTYDFIESQYHQIDHDDLISRVIVSLKKRKLHTSFFKPAQEVKPAPVKAKKASTGKVVAIKKRDLSKKKTATKRKSPAKKTAVPKKPTAKKAPAKKPSVKKPTAKKNAAKKTAALKKTVTKKPAVKKLALKKTVTKKPAARKTAAKKR